MSWKFNKAAAPASAAAPAAAPQPQANVVPPPTPPAASAAPAALPAFQPSPDPTPPAAVAPPAPPAAGRRRRASAPEVAAPAPAAPASVVAAPAAQAAAATSVIVAPAGGGALSRMLAPQAPVRMAAAAIADIASQGGGELNLFPTLSLQGGNSGGMLKLDEMNEEHSDDDLQEGTRPTYGVLMGYRILALCWPRAYSETAPKQAPRWRAVINAEAATDADLLGGAYRTYQFRQNRPEKNQPDPKWDPIGHITAAIELLVFEGKAGLICMRSAWTFDSFASTSKEIQGVWPDGIMGPKPVIITPASEMRNSKARQWMEHWLKVSHHMSAETAAAWESFKKFVGEAGGDPDLNQALEDWQKTTLTDEQRRTLDTMAQVV